MDVTSRKLQATVRHGPPALKGGRFKARLPHIARVYGEDDERLLAATADQTRAAVRSGPRG